MIIHEAAPKGEDVRLHLQQLILTAETDEDEKSLRIFSDWARFPAGPLEAVIGAAIGVLIAWDHNRDRWRTSEPPPAGLMNAIAELRNARDEAGLC